MSILETTRFDIRMRPRLSILNISTTLDILQLAIVCEVKLDQLIYFQPYPVTNFIFQKIHKRT